MVYLWQAISQIESRGKKACFGREKKGERNAKKALLLPGDMYEWQR
jgi:hypothetical protein